MTILPRIIKNQTMKECRKTTSLALLPSEERASRKNAMAADISWSAYVGRLIRKDNEKQLRLAKKAKAKSLAEAQ